MSFTPKYTLTEQILSALARINQINRSFALMPISPFLLTSLHSTAKYKSVHYSTKIEGNRLSLAQVESSLNTLAKHAPAHHERDVKEIKAYYNAIEYMEQHLKKGGALTETFIGKIHTLIEQEKRLILYRQSQNAIYNSTDGALVYLPPMAEDVPHLMADLVQWVNQNIEVLPVPIVAGLFHYQFVTIHPYFDGNGRTARLITSFLMQRYGYGLKGIYSLEEYYAADLCSYYQAIAVHPHHNYYEGRNTADLTPWLSYFIEGVARSFENVSAKAAEESSSAPSQSLLRMLDFKQRRALELFTSFQQITTAQLAAYIGISPQSAGLLAKKWVKDGFLQILDPSKKGRTYMLTERFEALFQK